MRTSPFLAFLALPLLAAGCKSKASDTVAETCPVECKAEASIFPGNNASGVALAAEATVELSEEARVVVTLRDAEGASLEAAEGEGIATIDLLGLVAPDTTYTLQVQYACEPGTDRLCEERLTSFTTRPPLTGTDTGTPNTTDTGTPNTTDTGTPNTTDTGRPDPGVPLGDAPELDAGALADIQSAIDAVRNGTTYSSGVYVVDADNGQVVYAGDEDVPMKPASNMKLFTTGLAFDQLGEEHRFRTRAYADAQPNGSGAVDTLTVFVEHDFTWSSTFYADAYVAADRLAEQLVDAGVRRVTGELVFQGEVVFDGYQFGYYDPSAHRSDGLDAVMEAFDLYGIAVDGTARTSSSFTTPGGVLLTERYSPPLHVADHPVNVVSHNEFADIHLRHDGWELYGTSSYDAGESAMLDWLGGVGVSTAGLAFVDGSGLSHSNRVTARSVVGLQQALYDAPSGLAWERTFSTGGVEGTLSGRLLGADTAGRFFGKTGTLSDTIATSGVLEHAYDGHRYLFGILFNDVGSQTTARSYCDQIIAAVASDRRQRGARPGVPVLSYARGAGSGAVELAWSSVPNTSHYGVYVSTDGAWRRADALRTSNTSITVSGLPDAPVAFTVVAINDQGESDRSDTYVAAPSATPAQVLLVDGNDRWDGQSENTLAEGHDSLHTVGRAVLGRPVDSADNDAVVVGRVDLSDYDAVIWLLGEESTADDTFDADERDAVADYLDGGGALLVSGAEIGWDLDYSGDSTTQDFYRDQLKASYAGDDAGTYLATPRAGGLFAGIGEVGFYTPGTMVIAYPDVLQPEGGARAELDYWGGTGGVAAVSYDGAYRLVHLGFPLESVDALEVREAMVEASLSFFGL